MRWASALVWPWLVMGSVPLEDSMRMSAKTIPVEMWTEATLEMAMLSSLLPNRRNFTRLTRCELTTSLVGKRKLPLVQRLAAKVSGWGVGGKVDMGLWYAGAGETGDLPSVLGVPERDQKPRPPTELGIFLDNLTSYVLTIEFVDTRGA